MLYLFGLLVFLYGLIIGSFFNALVYRIRKGKGVTGRSFCPNCKHQLSWIDLVPVLSYLVLGGRCRYCKKEISKRYVVGELSLGAILLTTFGFFNLTHQFSIESSKYLGSLMLVLLIVGCLFLISYYDILYQEIPNEFNVALLLISIGYLAYLGYLGGQPVIPNLLTGIFLFILFYSLVYFSKETIMGGGDAKMLFSLGIILGPLGSLGMIMFGSIAGSIYGLTLIGLKKAGLKTEVPFGPFLALGAYIFLLFGDVLINFYARIFIGT
jgi:leader peptidase (prepilin peptidase)/N-methyltransferase